MIIVIKNGAKKEQIESFDVPETVGVELDLAPFDWQDEDSDGIVYSLQRK